MEKIPFTVPSGRHEFNRLPFGLSNSPARFECLIELILVKLTEQCWVFVDNKTVFSHTQSTNMQNIYLVLDRTEKLQPKSACLQLPR
jgi:hypothetical protein